MDSSAPPTGRSRCDRAEIFGGSSFAGLLANGHLLLEGVPGLAKTLTVKTMADAFRPVSSDCNSRPILCLRFSWHAHLQSAHRRIHHQTWPNLFESNSGRRNKSRADQSQSALLEAMQEGRSPSANKPTASPIHSWFLPLKTQSNRKAPIDCLGATRSFHVQAKYWISRKNVRNEISLDLMATSAPDLRVDPVVDPKRIIAGARR